MDNISYNNYSILNNDLFILFSAVFEDNPLFYQENKITPYGLTYISSLIKDFIDTEKKLNIKN